MRKTKDVKITADGAESPFARDKGKVFHLTEMDADRAEAWAARALLAMTRSGMDVSPEMMSAGMAGVFSLLSQGVGGLSWHEAEPLLAEMMACVQIKEDKVTRELTPDDIEEVATRLKLRKEVWDLHTGFSFAGFRSNTTSETKPDGDTSNIKTSPEQ